jgi:hypothetical protein
MIEAGFDIPFKDPFGSISTAQNDLALFYGVGLTPFFSETVRIRVRCTFRYRLKGL